MGNWHAKKYLDGQVKGKIASQNILGFPKQFLMALHFFPISCPAVILSCDCHYN